MDSIQGLMSLLYMQHKLSYKQGDLGLELPGMNQLKNTWNDYSSMVIQWSSSNSIVQM